MTVVYWIVVVFLVMVFLMSACGLMSNRPLSEKQVDLVVLCFMVILLIAMKTMWR